MLCWAAPAAAFSAASPTTMVVYFIDCALIELDAAHPEWLADRLRGPWPRQPAAAHVGASATKSGAATGKTRGVIRDVAFHDHLYVDDSLQRAPRQLLIESGDQALHFSAVGDSGAAVVDDAGRAVGLLWGANTGAQSVACPMLAVLDHLGAELCSTEVERTAMSDEPRSLVAGARIQTPDTPGPRR